MSISSIAKNVIKSGIYAGVFLHLLGYTAATRNIRNYIINN